MSTVEFFAFRDPTPPPGGQSSGTSRSNLRPLTPVPDSIRRLTSASLREQLDASRDSDPPHMRRGLENITNQLARSQAEVARLEERCQMLEKALRGTREMLEARESELERVKMSSSQSSLPRTRGETAESTSVLLEEERAQLRATEVFMSRVDSMSGAQVVQAVHDLNSEIIQFAASAIELCTIDSNSPTSAQAMQDTTARLGSNLAGLLSARERNSQDPTLVGLALQAGIATCIARSMTTFALGLPSKSDVILSHLYSHIFGSEPQPTSSRWRALTHKYVHAVYPGLTEYSAEELRETICRWTSDILVAAGATHEGVSIRETFGEQIGRMVKAVARMAQICKEEIMSTNFDIVCPEAGQFFDERIMSDAFGGYGASHGAILATIELGLRRMTRRGHPRDGRTVEQQLLVRPKVWIVGTTIT